MRLWYLLVISAVGYYVREFGGDWGQALQVGFGVAALAALAMLLSSGAVRAHLRLEETTFVCGPEPFESGALVAETGIGAELRSRTVAGVRVYVLRHDPVRRDAADRGWAPVATSIHLDRVALA